MFEHLETLNPDPILGLMAAYREDAHPQKIDLGVGVYRDDSGATPIMAAVNEAEQRRHDHEVTKAYIGPPGTPEFNAVARALMFGANHAVISSGRIAGVQTPGGCGALRVGAELIKRARPETTIWVSDPTWANHVPLLGNAGLAIQEYAYYDRESSSLNADGMLAALSQVPAGDIVLLHGCCHNPSGVDLKAEHWHAVAELAVERGFTPFIDLAYQGLGDGLDEDAIGVRVMADACPELIVASSYSKNFGLYRERVGSLQIVSADTQQVGIVQSQLNSVVRGIYSMPPAHGAAIVEIILHDEALNASWIEELDGMRDRINGLRATLATRLTEATARDFSFIEEQRGMFSFLGITPQQVETLRTQYSIYMVDSSRINVAGVNNANIDYFVQAMGEVLA
ncbi:MAG: aromatic amino acid transaminase [Gammaproteobacteria bacterium]